MKIKPDDFKMLELMINDAFKRLGGKESVIERYETGQFSRADRVKDLQKRFRFDMFYHAVVGFKFCSDLYDYLNDNHIDTALKKIVSQSRSMWWCRSFSSMFVAPLC